MRLAVAGGSGYLGRAFVNHARARGHDVAATYWAHPLRHETAGISATWRQLDLRDHRAIDRWIAESAPEVIVNCAYLQGGPDLWRISTDTAAHLARLGPRLAHLSSDVIFAGRCDRAYREDDEPDPVHEYGRAKVAAEKRVLAHQPRALIVRTSLIYGGATPGPQERLVERALAGEDLAFFTNEVRNPVQVDDLARALLTLIERGSTGIFNVAGTDAVNRLQFAQLLAGARADELRGSAQAGGSPRPGEVALDVSKAATLLGPLQPRGVRTVLALA